LRPVDKKEEGGGEGCALLQPEGDWSRVEWSWRPEQNSKQASKTFFFFFPLLRFMSVIRQKPEQEEGRGREVTLSRDQFKEILMRLNPMKTRGDSKETPQTPFLSKTRCGSLRMSCNKMIASGIIALWPATKRACTVMTL